MKNRFLTILTLALVVTFASCKDKAQEVETTEAEVATEVTEVSTKYLVNTEASNIMWKGFKPTGTHTGTIKVESGVFTMNGDAIESGSFLIDMNSLYVTDLPEDDENHGKLTGHLKSPDFFDVEAFPASAFEVTGFTNENGKMMLSGNLKMKDTENNISIPVTVTENNDSITITSETFTVDRSKWNVKYGSKSFFDDLGDKFINDDMELQITITANKA
ncbi:MULTISPECIES: YceI family protein [Bizionia]|uniref:YceI family protein n=1 Tax=Bizionia algoritergicola TaxID=291187 RepID=A0A5D0QS46_9FLAO|nr:MULTISPECIES: YceI family protein [Bizionia]OBX21588.1 lipid-binding protein [Bizionia sp. APA-3]TYB72033.1 YceI family protein [Bizionia algoritergicola]